MRNVWRISWNKSRRLTLTKKMPFMVLSEIMVLNLPLCRAYCSPRKPKSFLSLSIASMRSCNKSFPYLPLCMQANMCSVFCCTCMPPGIELKATTPALLCWGSVCVFELCPRFKPSLPAALCSNRPGYCSVTETIFAPDDRSMRPISSETPPSRSSVRSSKKVAPHFYSNDQLCLNAMEKGSTLSLHISI